jgi:hemin uptake protein HemP
MAEPHKQEPSSPSDRKETEDPVVIDVRQLLKGRKEVWIEHEGVRYRLRVTRRNKLILQK